MAVLLHALEPHVLSVKHKPTRISDSRRLHRHGNAVSGASNRASSRVLETIFATELQRVLAGDFRLTLAVRRRTVRVVVSSVKGDLDGRWPDCWMLI